MLGTKTSRRFLGDRITYNHNQPVESDLKEPNGMIAFAFSVKTVQTDRCIYSLNHLLNLIVLVCKVYEQSKLIAWMALVLLKYLSKLHVCITGNFSA